jgi:hypothetical protein
VNRLGYEVRLSAISGIQSALQILFVVVAMIPVRFLMGWIFDRHAAVDWKTSLIVGCSIAALWYIAVCVSTFADLRREAARGRNPRQTFPASAFLTGLRREKALDFFRSTAAWIALGWGDPLAADFRGELKSLVYNS